MNNITGRIWAFGDNIDTDLIIAARYLNTSDPKELASHVMEDADPLFKSRVKVGDIIIAGENFGCGSSREHAPIALKAAGISVIIAKSFARIFYRNAFNMGLTILELKDENDIKEGDEVIVDLDSGIIKNKKSNRTYRFSPIPPFMQNLVDSGGLMEYAKKRNSEKL